MSELTYNSIENKCKLDTSIIPDESVSETLPAYLLNSKKYALEMENVHRQPFYQRNLVADLLITKATTQHSSGLVEEAIVCLEKALSVLLFVIYIHHDNLKGKKNYLVEKTGVKEKRLILREYIPSDSQEKNVYLKQKLTIFNILLLCYLEHKNYHDAYYACEESLKLDPHQNQILYFKQLISFIENKVHDKSNYSLIRDLSSNYLLLDEKLKRFVQSKFKSVVETINSIEVSLNRAITCREDYQNNYHLPTTVAAVKSTKDNRETINSHEFIKILPFWVALLAFFMIISTYFF